MSKLRVLALGAASALAGLLIAGCGSSSTNVTPAGSPATSSPAASSAATPTAAASPATSLHNDQDVTFASDMIPHHQQAIMMAQMVPSHSTDPQLGQLAASIQHQQQPEIDLMSGWLRSWGQPVPSLGTGYGRGYGMGGGMMGGRFRMPGMMDGDDFRRMQGMTGPGFRTMWLTGMIAHHQGAITMARQELDRSQYPPARQLAQNIITSQSAEITKMRQMLGQG